MKLPEYVERGLKSSTKFGPHFHVENEIAWNRVQQGEVRKSNKAPPTARNSVNFGILEH